MCRVGECLKVLSKMSQPFPKLFISLVICKKYLRKQCASRVSVKGKEDLDTLTVKVTVENSLSILYILF